VLLVGVAHLRDNDGIKQMDYDANALPSLFALRIGIRELWWCIREGLAFADWIRG
jgi:hypothetical protein